MLMCLHRVSMGNVYAKYIEFVSLIPICSFLKNIYTHTDTGFVQTP